MKRVKIFFVALAMMFSVGISAQSEKPVVGVYLSGGGALGFAHIGALQALEDRGIYPDVIEGSSMGALVGAYYCSGYSPQEIKDIILEDKFYMKSKIFAVGGAQVKGASIYTHKKVRDILTKDIHAETFEELDKKFILTVSNLTDSRTEKRDSGDRLIDWLLASMSIPVVFEPVIIGGKVYMDGGSLNHFPTQYIRPYADVLIGIDVMPPKKEVKVDNIRDVLTAYIHSLAISSGQKGREICDYVVDCHAIDKYEMLQFNEFEEIYQIGYDTMVEYLNKNPQLIKDCKEKLQKRWYNFWR